ncbi:MAG: hypothetical protein QXD32_00735 [Nitrososphaerota archaeon]
MKRNQKIAGAASLAALAYVLGLAPASIPFPLLPFLRFDLAEVPDVLAFLIFGWKYGIVTALAHWYALVITAQSGFAPPPIPQLMKLAAVLSMMLGVYAGLKVSRKLGMGRLLVTTGFAMAARAIVMTPITFVLYYFLLPSVYLPFGRRVLSAAGYFAETDIAVALTISGLTAVFNMLSSAIIVPASFSAEKALRKALGPRLQIPQP